MSLLGNKVLLIANPAAQNGAGAHAAQHAATLLREALGKDALDVRLTEAPEHAVRIASGAGGYDAVVALGGDGVIHEAANGLLRLPAENRPVFGIIPVGSGNDYARTLNMNARSVDRAVAQLLAARPQWFDVGLCNGRYFVETLSFGLDAAIALDTVERRKRTGKTGTMLYLESGIDQLLHHLDRHHYQAQVEGCGALQPHAGSTGAAKKRAAASAAEYAAVSESAAGDTTHASLLGVVASAQAGSGSPGARVDDSVSNSLSAKLEGDSYIFAVQIGQTYGGGFRICPNARTDDGLFDICIAHPPLGVAQAVFVFLLAKNAHHTRFKQLEFLQAHSLKLTFDAPLPAQIDGERIEATEYNITCIPHALEVLVP